MLLGLLGVALIAAVFVATRGGSQPSSVTPAPSPPAHSVPLHHAPAHPVAPAHVKPAPKPQATRPAQPRPTPQPSVGGKEQTATNAYNAGQIVVILFTSDDYQADTTKGSADDAGDAAAVKSVSRTPGVTAVSAGISNVGGFHKLLPNVPISQTPSIVVLSPGQPARLIEGLVDPTTLAQTIADLRG
jgi:hypothetical protein